METRKFAIVGSRGYPSTYGGFETLVRHLAPWLADRGHEVVVYSREKRRGDVGPVADPRVRVVHTPGIDTATSSTLTYGMTSTLHAVCAGVDAILMLNVANGFWLRAARARGIPVAVNVDGIEWERDKWNRVGKKLFELGAVETARSADTLVADSEAIRDYWLKRFGRDSRFIPYGAEVFPFRAAVRIEKDLGLRSRRYALVVARLVPENNVNLALSAAESGQLGVPLVVVGSTPGSSDLKTRAEKLAREGRILWLGHVGDQDLLAELWQHAGVYIHGHSVGGTNPALLQALGAGSPTVVFDSAYNREVVGPKFPVFSGSVPSLVKAATEVLGDDNRQRELASLGRSTVTERYQWSQICSEYSALLEGLVEPQPPTP